MAQHILILHSADGSQWARAILYPAAWDGSFAEKKAQTIIAAVAAKSCDWTWDECEEPLIEAGFTITNWRNSREYWDDQVSEEDDLATA